METPKQQGFTLIEVMVALAVVSISLLALTQGLGQFVFHQAGLQERVAATWVAQNRLVELRYTQTDSIEAQKTEKMFGQQWEVEFSTEPTLIPNVFKVTVNARLEGANRNSATVVSITGQEP